MSMLGGGITMKIYLTKGINDKIADDIKFAKEIVDFLKSYCKHDFGDLDEYDKKMNEDAIKYGGRILAAYHTKGGEKIYIITENTLAKEWVTTVMFASEY